MTDSAHRAEWPYSAPATAPRYVPSKTVEEFIWSVVEGPPLEHRLLILQGPRGEGKTTGGLVACVALAEDLRAKGLDAALPVKVGVVRDTWTNLQRTTLASFEENKRKGMPIEFSEGGREASIMGGGGELVHFWFFGLDRPEDADKLQGFTCGVYWLEEVAPAAGLATGIPDTAMLGTTSVRQAGVPKRTIVTMNPPDEDHWIIKVEKFLDDMNIKQVRVKRFEMIPGEKSAHFEELAAQTSGDESMAWQMAADEFDAYRMANQAFLQAIGRGDLEARLVRGETGFAQTGEAVVPVFSKALHVSKTPLPVYQGLEILRFWDSGTPNLHPAVVFCQAKPPYWLNVLASRTGENVGILEFIREQVVPLQHKYGWLPPKSTKDGFAKGARGGFRFRDIGDPACLIPEGTSSQRTVALAIQEALGTAFEPGPQDWSSRREALLAGFARPGKGDRSRMIQVDPEENDLLIRALAGRFHYPKDHATGRILGTIVAAKRVSGIHSHAVDCLGYGLGVMFPAEEWARPPRPPRSPSPEPSSWMGA